MLSFLVAIVINTIIFIFILHVVCRCTWRHMVCITCYCCDTIRCYCCCCHCQANGMLNYKYGITFFNTRSLTTNEWYVDWYSMAQVCLIDCNDAVVHVCWEQSTNKTPWGQQWSVHNCLFLCALEEDSLSCRSMCHCLYRCCLTCFVIVKDGPCGENESAANKNTTTQCNAFIINVCKAAHRRNVNSIAIWKRGRHDYLRNTE